MTELLPGSPACKRVVEIFAEQQLQSIQARTLELKEKGCKIPHLVAFLANNDYGSQKYATAMERAFCETGLSFEVRTVSELALPEEIAKANCDPEVDGIMIYYPVSAEKDNDLRNSVSPLKDVEGLGVFHKQLLNKYFVDEVETKKCILPCTPLAVMKLLKHVHVLDGSLPKSQRASGKTICIFNRSEVVGGPLAVMLSNMGAVVFSIDVDSIHVYKFGKKESDLVRTEAVMRSCSICSDAVILGVPDPNFRLEPSWLKENAIVLNVSSCRNIDLKTLLSIRPGVQYLGQIGRATIVMLQRNLLRLHDYNMSGKWGEAQIPERNANS